MTWNNENSEIISINGSYTGTSLVQIYLPLTGTTNESTTATDADVTFLSNSKTVKILSVNFMTTSAMGATVFTILANGSTIGTKTVTIDTTDVVFRIDFETELDSGTNETLLNEIGVGVNPATAGSVQNFSVVIERNLF